MGDEDKVNSEHNGTLSDLLVVFGITGDLAFKMTIPALYRLERSGYLNCAIVGVAIDDYDDTAISKRFRDSLENAGEHVEHKVISALLARFSYLQGDFLSPSTYDRLRDVVSHSKNPLFYLEVPPALFAHMVKLLTEAGLSQRAKVLIEKPFGTDLASAKALNKTLHGLVEEDQILRIDHFLGKQPLMDLAYIRFANQIIEPLLDRVHMDSIQITMAEDFGVDDRGSFYDRVGAIRDVVQNHLLQVLALVTMDTPLSGAYKDIWDKKVEALRAVSSMDIATSVMGQYDGYLEVPGVSPNSQTETFFATKVSIESWRYFGVPIFIRTGKYLKVRSTEIRVVFKPAPELSYIKDVSTLPPNQMILRIDPKPALRLSICSKDSTGSSGRVVHMDLPFEEELGRLPMPYERLLHDALVGEYSLFTREDAVEESWRIVQPLLDGERNVVSYQKGGYGPKEARHLCKGHLGWQEPWL